MVGRIRTGLLAILLSLSFSCGSRFNESTFRTVAPLGDDEHLWTARRMIGPTSQYGSDKDVDGDGMNDLYVVSRDGRVYTTLSRNLLDGRDTWEERRWYRNLPEVLEDE